MITHQKLVDMIEDASANQDATQLHEILNTYFRMDDMPSPLRPFAPPIHFDEDEVEGVQADRAAEGLALANRTAEAIRKIHFEEKVVGGQGRLRIIAQGDSWFQYPLRRRDIVDHLGRQNAILSLSGGSGTLEEMLARKDYLGAIRAHKPDVFLMSAGGNDLISRDVLRTTLRPFEDGASAEDLIDEGGLADRMRVVIDRVQDIVSEALDADETVVACAHGYDHPWPRTDGPWLGTPLMDLGIPLDVGRDVLAHIIDRFNDGLHRLESEFGERFRHVDLRGHVDRGAVSWFDELHPMDDGYARAAACFESVLNELVTDPVLDSSSKDGETQEETPEEPARPAAGPLSFSATHSSSTPISAETESASTVSLANDTDSLQTEATTMASGIARASGLAAGSDDTGERPARRPLKSFSMAEPVQASEESGAAALASDQSLDSGQADEIPSLNVPSLKAGPLDEETGSTEDDDTGNEPIVEAKAPEPVAEKSPPPLEAPEPSPARMSFVDTLPPLRSEPDQVKEPVQQERPDDALSDGNPNGASPMTEADLPPHMAVRERVQAAREQSMKALRDHLRDRAEEQPAPAPDALDELLTELHAPDTEERLETRMRLAPFGDAHYVERILGESETYPFSYLEKGRRTGDAVARINMTAPDGTVIGHGTGFLVAPGLLLTNRHVLGGLQDAAQSHVLLDYDLDEFGLPKPTHCFAFTDRMFLSSDDLDYTFVSVAAESQGGLRISDFGWIPLIRPSGKALKHERVSIIYHPRGDYKKVGLRQSLVIGVHDSHIYYTSNTEQECAGAPVLNDHWQVVCLHQRAIPDPEQPERTRAHQGLRISAIFEDLERRQAQGDADASQILDLISIRHSDTTRAFHQRQLPGPMPRHAETAGPRRSQDRQSTTARRRMEDGHAGDPDPEPGDVCNLSEITLDAAEADTAEMIGVDLNTPGVASLEDRLRRYRECDVDWVGNHRNHPDTWHLPPTSQDVEFDLRPEVLEAIGRASHFEPPIGGHGKLLFALRGAMLAHGEDEVEDQEVIRLKSVRPNHHQFRCVVGVYDTQTKQLSAYRGSTVPNAWGVIGYYDFRNCEGDTVLAGLLPAGCYEFSVGTHFARRLGPIPGVLRLGSGPATEDASWITILRTENDVTYGNGDIWDECRPMTNILPAFGSRQFASLGAITLVGSQTPAGAATKQWSHFRAKAGFDTAAEGTRYDLILVTGMEAAATAAALDGKAGEEVDLRCLRHGSKGEPVRRLQRALRYTDHGDFDAGTKRDLAVYQREQLGYATGTMTPAMADLLGLEIFAP